MPPRREVYYSSLTSALKARFDFVVAVFVVGKIDEDTVDSPQFAAIEGDSRKNSSSSSKLGQLTKRIYGESRTNLMRKKHFKMSAKIDNDGRHFIWSHQQGSHQGGLGVPYFGNLRYFRPQPAENTVNSIVFYDTRSTYREAYGKFFLIGDPLARRIELGPFFRLRSFCSFYFWSVFFSLVPDCTTTQRKLSPAVKYPLFRCSVYLLGGSNDCVFLYMFFPCTHSGKVEQASMVLRQRPSHHKDADT